MMQPDPFVTIRILLRLQLRSFLRVYENSAEILCFESTTGNNPEKPEKLKTGKWPKTLGENQDIDFCPSFMLQLVVQIYNC